MMRAHSVNPMEKIYDIYVWYEKGSAGKFSTDIAIYAISEDGELLMHHISTNESYFERDAGFTSDFAHERRYKRKYPNGNYRLVKVTPPRFSEKRQRQAYEKFKRGA